MFLGVMEAWWVNITTLLKRNYNMLNKTKNRLTKKLWASFEVEGYYV